MKLFIAIEKKKKRTIILPILYFREIKEKKQNKSAKEKKKYQE